MPGLVERPASELVGPDAQENVPGRNALQREGRPGQPEQRRAPLDAVLKRSGTEIRVIAGIAFPCGHAVQGSGTWEFETDARPGPGAGRQPAGNARDRHGWPSPALFSISSTCVPAYSAGSAAAGANSVATAGQRRTSGSVNGTTRSEGAGRGTGLASNSDRG